MVALDDFEFVYDVFEDGTAAVSRSRSPDERGVDKRVIEERVEFPVYEQEAEHFVRTTEGGLIEVEELQQARLYAGLRALFGDMPLDVEPRLVPVKVALDTKPAIAMFLLTSQYPKYKQRERPTKSLAKSVIGARLDVSPQTVGTYFSRIGKRCREKRVGGDLDYYEVK